MRDEKISPLRAIRAKCFDCSGGSRQEITLCPVKGCPLHPFRSGKNPFTKKRTLTPEQKAAAAARLSARRNRRPLDGRTDEECKDTSGVTL